MPFCIQIDKKPIFSLNQKLKKDQVNIVYFLTPYLYEHIETPYFVNIRDVAHRILPHFPEFSANRVVEKIDIKLSRFLRSATKIITCTDVAKDDIKTLYNIIDYKTGQARTLKEIKSGYAPQLPIEALIAQSGGFDGLSSAPISQLMYWKLNDKVISLSEDIDNLISQTSEHIIEIINLFAKEETGYLSRPNPKHIPEYSDYEHLARVKEWSIQDKGDDN
jgi:hypothetical protein